MVTKKIVAPLFIVILVAGISGVFAAKKMTQERVESTSHASEVHEHDNSSLESSSKNSNTASNYDVYTETASQNKAFKNTVLFFNASWCPECRAFDKALASSTIPADTQILKVDYDKASDLKKKYGVTLQSTFVSIDSDGKLLSKWVGYGKDKSADAVIKNLKL